MAGGPHPWDQLVRPPVFNDLNTRVPHVRGFVSSHVHNLLNIPKRAKQYSVRNTWHASNLWINSNLPQVLDFSSSWSTFDLNKPSDRLTYEAPYVAHILICGGYSGSEVVELWLCSVASSARRNGIRNAKRLAYHGTLVKRNVYVKSCQEGEFPNIPCR
ncbi:hypothetical protein RND71_014416 [Anisodus tanguticus]|uniref:Uncharacterized protein n=1 Tax=Anisodus tanguticus TaxID=243964 RepID=A0AAE1VJW5_9SOLA|nr:hypothetical protein RND71_014416 [Anisodus tanguticus]